jgi:hypothetical protein
MPTSETLLGYVKTLTCDDILASAEAQVERCIKELKKKGLSTKNVAIGLDWYDAPYYGKKVAGVIGTPPKDGTCYAFSFAFSFLLRFKKFLSIPVDL